MKILIDSRERLPVDFNRYDTETEIRGLPVGDYSIPGFIDKTAVERKSIDDFIAVSNKAEIGKHPQLVNSGRC